MKVKRNGNNPDVQTNNKVGFFGKVYKPDDTARTVISTRLPAPGDEEEAKALNIHLVHCPVYEYHWMIPSEQICDAILSESIPDAWIFTSRRGVEGWWRIWKDKSHTADIPPVYVVGDKTDGAFRKRFGSSDIRKANEQNGKALAFRMLDDGIRSAVHFCAVERRSELRNTCRLHGVDLREVEVYRRFAVKVPEPVDDPVDAILFFSPDGVSEFLRLYGLPDGAWQAIAVGSTTAGAVRRETGREPRIAKTPSFREMIKLI